MRGGLSPFCDFRRGALPPYGRAMMTRPVPLLLCLAFGLLLAAGAGAESPRAADMVRAELLPGWRQGPDRHMAGLRLRLAEQWKTYWRSPGEAGVPPVFDFAGSENLAAVEVLWPAPRIFELNGLRTIGYAREVVLPLAVTPRDPGRDVVLRGQMEIGVCRDICLPISLSVEAELPAAATAPDLAIRAAVAAVPRRIPGSGLRCRVAPISDGLRVTAEADLPPQGGAEMVVMETPDPQVWVSESQVRRDGRRLAATADLVPPGGAPFALDRSRLRVTVLGATGVVEMQGCLAG